MNQKPGAEAPGFFCYRNYREKCGQAGKSFTKTGFIRDRKWGEQLISGNDFEEGFLVRYGQMTMKHNYQNLNFEQKGNIPLCLY